MAQQQPDTILRIDDFEFSTYEIPERISTGGEQDLAIHQLVGGVRVIDAMGRSDAPLEWSGYFRGFGALNRSLQLEALRVGGLPHTLTWSQFNYQVIVRSYRADYEKSYEIPYRIVCEVVKDNTSPTAPAGQQPVDDAINQDMATATTLAGQVNDPTLNIAMGALAVAVGAVASFGGAPGSVVSSVLQPLAVAQAQVSVLMGDSDSTASGASGFAGLIPGVDAMSMASLLTSQTGNCLQLTSLAQLQGTLGRIGQNLTSINGSPNTVTLAGGNLFQVADAQYGDPGAWTGIAKANRLVDPFVTGPQTLSIPIRPDQASGILGS